MVIKGKFRGSSQTTRARFVSANCILIVGDEYILELTSLERPGEIKAVVRDVQFREEGKDPPFMYYSSFVAFLSNWTDIKTNL